MEFNVDPGTGVFDGGVVTPTSFDASIQAAADSAEEFANVGDIRECYRKKPFDCESLILDYSFMFFFYFQQKKVTKMSLAPRI